MGKVDQGVFTYWMLAHHFERPLSYIGFGGTGKQVRDLLHVEDLVDLLDEQLGDPQRWTEATVNVGGGRECSLSLCETTELCRQITGRTIDVAASAKTRPGDIPYTSPTAAGCMGWPTGARAAVQRRYCMTSTRGSSTTRQPLRPRSKERTRCLLP